MSASTVIHKNTFMKNEYFFKLVCLLPGGAEGHQALPWGKLLGVEAVPLLNELLAVVKVLLVQVGFSSI